MAQHAKANKNVAKATFFYFSLIVGLEKEVAEFRAGLEPAETKVKIILQIIFPTRVVQSHFGHQNKNVANATFFYFT